MNESAEWKGHFELFNTFSSKLANESHQLKLQLEKEKKVLRRLSGVVSEQNTAHENLKSRLNETERAHETAVAELEKVSIIQQEIEMQRDAMLHEISSILPATSDVLSSVCGHCVP